MNATTTFNEYDPKYMYWLHMLHVTTVTSIICIMGLLWYLLAMFDVLFVENSHRQAKICNLFTIMISSLGFALAFMGIMDAKPLFIYFAIACMLGRLAGGAMLALFFLGACTPDSFLQRFCHYMYKKMCELGGRVYDEKVINDFHVLSLLHYGFTFIVDYCTYCIFKECYQFYKDQPDYKQYPRL